MLLNVPQPMVVMAGSKNRNMRMLYWHCFAIIRCPVYFCPCKNIL